MLTPLLFTLIIQLVAIVTPRPAASQAPTNVVVSIASSAAVVTSREETEETSGEGAATSVVAVVAVEVATLLTIATRMEATECREDLRVVRVAWTLTVKNARQQLRENTSTTMIQRSLTEKGSVSLDSKPRNFSTSNTSSTNSSSKCS